MSNPNTICTDRSRPWLDERGNLLRRLPAACIAECSGPGDRGPAVRHWRERLRFQVPTGPAVECLADLGAWERGELEATDPDTLSERCLWLLCCDAREFRSEGDPNAQPYGLLR